MKKLFISQPMNGKTADEILAERELAIQKAVELSGQEVEVIDTYYTDFKEGAKPLEFLGRSIMDMANADMVFFAKGWANARGCRIEHACATEYGLTILKGE